MNNVSIKTYTEPEYDIKEILRYSGISDCTDETKEYAIECIEEIRNKLIYKVCYTEEDVSICDNEINLGHITTKSKNLSYMLKNSRRAIIFCATIGLNIDREIAKYLRVSPSKALMLQAIGTERCESLCNMFVNDIKDMYKDEEIFLTPRFSPGYGDLGLELQRDIFKTLDLPRKIGVTLNESLVISPSKSVTAIIGLSKKDCGYNNNKCTGCTMKECTFRK